MATRSFSKIRYFVSKFLRLFLRMYIAQGQGAKAEKRIAPQLVTKLFYLKRVHEDIEYD